MRYSKYFGQIVKDQGTPYLSESSFQKMMNIVFLEGKVEGLKKARKLEKESPGKFDMPIFSLGKQLTDLTGNIEPKELLKILITNL